MTIEVVGQLKTVMVVAFGYIFFDAPWHSLATSSLGIQGFEQDRADDSCGEGCKGNKMGYKYNMI